MLTLIKRPLVRLNIEQNFNWIVCGCGKICPNKLTRGAIGKSEQTFNTNCCWILTYVCRFSCLSKNGCETVGYIRLFAKYFYTTN